MSTQEQGTTDTLRRCPRCEQARPLSEFPSVGSRKQSYVCTECWKPWRREVARRWRAQRKLARAQTADPRFSRRFSGSFWYSVDPKRRLVVPQEFRGELGREFMLCRLPDREADPPTLVAIPLAKWRKMRFAKWSEYLESITYPVQVTAEHRIQIPPPLHQHLGLHAGEEVVWVGAGVVVYLRRGEAWSSRLSVIEAGFVALLEQLAPRR